jgi:hypothetical protein
MSSPDEFADLPEPPKRQLVSERTLSRITDIPVKTLQAWRFRGAGPNFYKVNGTRVRYDLTESLDWCKSQPRRRRVA